MTELPPGETAALWRSPVVSLLGLAAEALHDAVETKENESAAGNEDGRAVRRKGERVSRGCGGQRASFEAPTRRLAPKVVDETPCFSRKRENFDFSYRQLCAFADASTAVTCGVDDKLQ